MCCSSKLLSTLIPQLCVCVSIENSGALVAGPTLGRCVRAGSEPCLTVSYFSVRVSEAISIFTLLEIHSVSKDWTFVPCVDSLADFNECLSHATGLLEG